MLPGCFLLLLKLLLLPLTLLLLLLPFTAPPLPRDNDAAAVSAPTPPPPVLAADWLPAPAAALLADDDKGSTSPSGMCLLLSSSMNITSSSCTTNSVAFPPPARITDRTPSTPSPPLLPSRCNVPSLLCVHAVPGCSPPAGEHSDIDDPALRGRPDGVVDEQSMGSAISDDDALAALLLRLGVVTTPASLPPPTCICSLL